MAHAPPLSPNVYSLRWVVRRRIEALVHQSQGRRRAAAHDTSAGSRREHHDRSRSARHGRAASRVGSPHRPNQHDILTGSDSHGRVLLGAANTTTCGNWTSNGEGRAMIGHHDRLGGGNSSWNAVHLTRSCSQSDFVATGGTGLLQPSFLTRAAGSRWRF